MNIKNSIILDIVSEYPQTEDVFRTYDEKAGKCVLCNFLFETPIEFSQQIKIDEEVLIKEIEDKILG